MKQKSTKDALGLKLNQTSVPDVAKGWEAMQALLDISAVTRKQRATSLMIRRAAVAAVCLALIGFSIWQLVFRAQPETPAPPKTRWAHNSPQALPSPANTTRKQTRPRAVPVRKSPVKGSESSKRLADYTVSSGTKNELINPSPLPPLPVTKPLSVPDHPDLQPSPVVLQPIPRQDQTRKRYTAQLLAQRSHNRTAELGAAVQADHPVHISVKLQANGGASFGKPQENFNPVLKGTPVDVYPAVYISKNISEHLGLQAGVAVVSPVDISNGHLNKSVRNAGGNMVAMAVESRHNFRISRLYYIDVPVTVQYHLTERFTVGSGLQLSVLEKVIGSRQRVDYNANYMVMYAAPSDPAPADLTGNQEANYGINPLDLRWLGSLNYLIGERWIASLQLQYGLLDISDNHAFLRNHRDRNVVVSAGIGFKIK